MGKSTINGPFSIAMLNYQRVYHGISWAPPIHGDVWPSKFFAGKRTMFAQAEIWALAIFWGSTTLLLTILHIMVSNCQYPLVICYIAIERSTIFNGKINYKYYKSPFSIAFCMFTRGYHPILCGRNRLEQMLLASIGIYWLIGSFPCFESSGFQIGQIYDMQT